MPFVALDPPPTGCPYYGRGCCHDRHFDPAEVLPAKAGQPVCGNNDGTRSTTDKKVVNCTDCLELIHA